MKKIIVSVVIGLLVVAMVAPLAQAGKGSGKGGWYPMCAGCLFGARAAAAVNEGKQIHFMTEWMQLIFSPVSMVINGLNGYNGMTTKDLANTYGSAFF